MGIAIAQYLRKNLTIPEKLLWQNLRNKKLDGFKFRRQHPVYRYILDFYCSEIKLAIEVDGNIHQNRNDYDEYRDEILKNIGIQVLRFTNKEIIEDIDQVLIKIKNKLII